MLTTHESKLIQSLFLSSAATLKEISEIRGYQQRRGFLRDLTDEITFGLCQFSLGEAGRSGFLHEFELVCAALRGSPETAWKEEGNPAVMTALARIADNVNADNREKSRWMFLELLGSPGVTESECATNTAVRVLCARALDGVCHPIVAAELLSLYTHLTLHSTRSTTGALNIITSALELRGRWYNDPTSRHLIEEELLAAMRGEVWQSEGEKE